MVVNELFKGADLGWFFFLSNVSNASGVTEPFHLFITNIMAQCLIKMFRESHTPLESHTVLRYTTRFTTSVVSIVYL